MWDSAALDREFSPSLLAPGFEDVLRTYAERSAEARSACPGFRTLSYGEHPDEVLDHFPAREPGSPLHVFIHGGHWQELSKDESSFAALDFLARGHGFAALNYGLAPRRSLEEIVGSAHRALCWIRDNAAALGTRPDAVHASGSSAGAHLLAMACCLDDRAPGNRPPLASACLISGTYDLEPLRHSYVNDALGLDEQRARALSPLHELPCRVRRLVLARGERETGEYIRQHQLFSAAARRAGHQVTDVVVAGTNHFDVVFGLADPAGPLGAAVLADAGPRPAG
ncbi:arylformamidase [Saccharopolyspora antimicrobica]|uniref:Arylformamidase n=1 Tax=Saccharopolyspora antimicrobica TaxID=455193 RepID=A0A1I5KYJ7_9PSEU|nr:alpha/beta hydrolase [Saccharopolyspora antimicrobica]RKT89081.1 arylformamidase [Saccharopolyspora antimicrobica]SFO90139.1 arylformamidase [Saccharopolyspora antimicrobica]